MMLTTTSPQVTLLCLVLYTYKFFTCILTGSLTMSVAKAIKYLNDAVVALVVAPPGPSTKLP
jgi:hypothetical protein